MDFLHRAWAEIDMSALIHNFKILKNKAQCPKIMAVVKANAYGHSVTDIAPALQEAGADAFGVSNIEEAVELRECGIEKPILILGYTPAERVETLCKNDITQCVYSSEYASVLSKEAVKKGLTVKIHIKLDTGMGRIGFDCRNDSLSGINQAINSAMLNGFSFEGIFTHFAVADRTSDEDDGFTNKQYSRFLNAIEHFKQAGIYPKCCHCCNSAGILLDNDKHFDMSRAGVSIYGLKPSSALSLTEEFIPVMTLKSVVTMVKEINAGDTVSYGRTFKAEKKMKIATVAAGYADGYPRLLSNKGYVFINGKKAPITGRICMDQLAVDVTDISDVKMGSEVELFGKNLGVDELARLCGTINYEIVCDITKRVPRIILR